VDFISQTYQNGCMAFILSVISLVILTIVYFGLLYLLDGPVLAYYARWIGWLFVPIAAFLMLEIKKEKSFIRHHVSSKILHRLEDKRLVNYLIYGWVFVIAVCFIIAIPFMLLFDKQFTKRKHNNSKILHIFTNFILAVLCLVVALNVATTYYQCGLEQCPDNPTEYKLL